MKKNIEKKIKKIKKKVKKINKKKLKKKRRNKYVRHVRHSCDHVLLRPCSVGTIEKIYISKIVFLIFFCQKKSLSLLRCGPDNKRTKEKRKTIKIK